MATNVKKEPHRVSREQRAKALSGWHARSAVPFRGCTVWLTGLPAAGKTTLAMALEELLVSRGIAAYSLDGDNIRAGLNRNLGFSNADREENIRRGAEVAKLFADSGQVCITSFISPFAKDRALAKKIHDDISARFFEVHISTPLEECEKRDPKGDYAKARAGQLPGFTGVDGAYEAPKNPNLEFSTKDVSVEQCVEQLVSMLVNAGVIPESLLNVVHELFVPSHQVERLVVEANELPSLAITKTDLQWVQVLAEGWAAPLTGFMTENQYLQCLHFGTLFDEKSGCNTNMTLPIVLPLTTEDKNRVANEKVIALSYTPEHSTVSRIVAILHNPEFFEHRKEERCCRIFGTFHQGHPGVAQILESGDWLVGGNLDVLGPIKWNDGMDKYRLTPNELRNSFREMQADCVFAFQHRNPIHNGHALLMADTRKQLIERGYKNPVLYLSAIGGWTKDDDVPLNVRIMQHEAMLDANLDGLKRDQLVMAIFPSPMTYSGPREVQWHCRTRIVAGAQFFIVGRDPNGIPHPADKSKNLYEAAHGPKVVALAQGLDLLEIIPFRVAAYDRATRNMILCDVAGPTSGTDLQFVSGTKIRQFARSGTELPPGFMVPEAWRVLAERF